MTTTASRSETRAPLARALDHGRAIVVAADFSESSRNALARAVDLARIDDAILHVVYVAPPTRAAFWDERHTMRLQEAIDAVVADVRATGVPASPHLLHGRPVRAVRDIGKELRAELIVVGARGRLMPDAIVGSTAERIATRAERPVLLVREPADRPYPHVLLAIDLRSDLKKSLAAIRLVAPFADVTLLHAYEGPYEAALLLHGTGPADMRSYRAETRRELQQELAGPIAEAGLDPAALVLRHGSPRRVLEREERRRRGTGTLFVLERGRSVLLHILFGSLSRWVIAQGQSDVLLV